MEAQRGGKFENSLSKSKGSLLLLVRNQAFSSWMPVCVVQEGAYSSMHLLAPYKIISDEKPILFLLS